MANAKRLCYQQNPNVSVTQNVQIPKRVSTHSVETHVIAEQMQSALLNPIEQFAPVPRDTKEILTLLAELLGAALIQSANLIRPASIPTVLIHVLLMIHVEEMQNAM